MIEVADLSRQINLEADRDDVQELLYFLNQELTINELVEMHEQEQGVFRPSSIRRSNDGWEFDRSPQFNRKKENKIVETLAKVASGEAPEPSAPLTFLEIFSKIKHQNKTSRAPLVAVFSPWRLSG
ncbi:hypothetical protein TNCV_1175921 [Trichonephila clavipes]|nr:hypothetical protein TNCV_1175921 [Trichonephila clavipes]